MVKLIGEDCPLLFDKWQPKEFQDFYEGDKSRFSQCYVFDFAYVWIESHNIHLPEHKISAHGVIH
ncbi:hypothetical protein GOV06_01635, partial [Candidatus Woesearchaeota archaeon]|nr:hypothetical protein [Candidatus Woesearchaeota archaeon]